MKRTGEWIMINQTLPTEIPVGRMEVYYAKPCKHPYIRFSRTDRGQWELASRFSKSIDQDKYQELLWRHLNGLDVPKEHRESIEIDAEEHQYRIDDFVWPVKIVTPFGEVKVWAEEYVVVSLEWVLDLVKEGAYMIRYLSNDGSVRSSLKSISVRDKLFYLQTRGIDFKNAMKALSGEIKSQYLFYFDPYPHYVHVFERDYIALVKNKIEYCEARGAQQLLEYKDTGNGEFTIMDYLEHLNIQSES